jgi:hypothetical protein
VTSTLCKQRTTTAIPPTPIATGPGFIALSKFHPACLSRLCLLAGSRDRDDMAMIAARSPFSAYLVERPAVLHRHSGASSVPGQRPLRPHSRSSASWRRNRQINRGRGRVAIASKGIKGNADKNSPELPLTEEECAAYERKCYVRTCPDKRNTLRFCPFRYPARQHRLGSSRARKLQAHARYKSHP